MDVKNVLASVSYLDFVNKINALANELMYGANGGYINLKSKDAIISAKTVLEKFSANSSKLRKEIDSQSADKLIQAKKEDLAKLVKKHYDSQIPVWIDEVFEQLSDNLLFEVSINKQKANAIYNDLICAINWYCDIKKLDKFISENYNDYEIVVGVC